MPILNTLLQCIMRSAAHPSERQEYRTIPTHFSGNSGSLNSTHHPGAEITWEGGPFISRCNGCKGYLCCISVYL